MKILTLLVSFIISFILLWIIYHFVATPLELLVFISSTIVFAILWFLVIRLEYSGNKNAAKGKKNLGCFILSFQVAYIIFHILNLESYEKLAFIAYATSLFGLPALGVYQLIKDKVFD